MAFPDEPQGSQPPSENPSTPGSEPGSTPDPGSKSDPGSAPDPGSTPPQAETENTSYSESWQSFNPDPPDDVPPPAHSSEPTHDATPKEEPPQDEHRAVTGTVETTPTVPAPVTKTSGGGGRKPPPPPKDPKEEEEEGMAKMSFVEHLEDLRKRLIYAVGGIGVAFFLCLLFSDELWYLVRQPAARALMDLGVNPPNLHQISPMDTFQIIWMKLPILAAIFVSSPWILYQVWAFIAPGLYQKEKRYAVPFVVSSAGLFPLGGVFAYFVAFRYGLEFLLGLGIPQGITPTISVLEYYDLFVDVMLGVGLIFEIPILLFLLTLIRVANPVFLVNHSRYAILVIVFLAAVITPTGDVFNLALFATPMIILFYVGIFASYLLVLKRENRRFPWGTFIRWTLTILVVLVAIGWLVARYYGYHFVTQWPFFVR
jgi:sec-independent protein translocase protein TatC